MSNIIDNFDEVIFKLGDLGTAQSFGDDDTTAQTTECVGTPNFCPPEMLAFQLIPRAKRVPISVKPCDVYSLGASLARALIPKDDFKQHVTNGTLYNHMIDIWTRQVVQPGLSAEVALFIRKMINPQTSERPTIDQVLNDKWLRVKQKRWSQPVRNQLGQFKWYTFN